MFGWLFGFGRKKIEVTGKSTRRIEVTGKPARRIEVDPIADPANPLSPLSPLYMGNVILTPGHGTVYQTQSEPPPPTYEAPKMENDYSTPASDYSAPSSDYSSGSSGGTDYGGGGDFGS